MEYVQMDQMEMVHVLVILVIQLLIIQLIIVLFVLMIMSWMIQFVSNVLKLVKLVNSIQLIVLRNFFFPFVHTFLPISVISSLFRCKLGYTLQTYNYTCTSNCEDGTYNGPTSCTRMFFRILLILHRNTYNLFV